MDTRKRAEAFTAFVGLELKGRIISQGFTASHVAKVTGRSPAAFNRWLNGKSEIPLTALCESCEVIGVEPRTIVEYAYDRLAAAYGELDGETYDAEAIADALARPDDVVPAAVVHLRPVSVPVHDDADEDMGHLRAASEANDDDEFEAQQQEP